MSTLPCISIIIPTYNQGHLIGECLESIRSQTVSDWEAIVVNNFSDDNTEQIVENFQDSRIRLLRFRNHGVIAASRNEGVKQAKAPFLAFLDSDDVWYPTKVEKALEAMQVGHEIICHAEKWVHQDGAKRVFKYGPAIRASYSHLLFDGNCLSTSAVTMSKGLFKAVGGFSEKHAYITAEDYDLWLNITRIGTSIYFIDNVLGEYRLHGENQSSAAERNYRAIMEVLKFHFSTHMQPTIINRIKIQRRFALAAYGCGRSLQAQKHYKLAYRWLIKSIYLWPFTTKQWAALVLNILGSIRSVN